MVGLMIDLKKMCDHCYRILGSNEPMFGFVLVDDNGYKRPFKGHEGCVKQMTEIIQSLYGVNESENALQEASEALLEDNQN